MKLLKASFYFAAIVALLTLAVSLVVLDEAALSVRDEGVSSIRAARASVAGLADDVHELLLEAKDTTRQARHLVDEALATSLQERKHVAELAQSSVVVVRDLHETVQAGTSAIVELRSATGKLESLSDDLRADARPVAVNTARLIEQLQADSARALQRLTEAEANLNALVVAASPIVPHAIATSRHVENSTAALDRYLNSTDRRRPWLLRIIGFGGADKTKKEQK